MSDNAHSNELQYTLIDGNTVPSLAFGLYKVPATKEGEKIIANAIAEGYRHFDSASIYGNEKVLGEAIRKSDNPRDQFFICTKVWNDAQKEGRDAVRKSVEQSLKDLQLNYLDVVYIHWPVPGCFVETYKELQLLHQEQKIRYIGLSNFGISDYEELRRSKAITVFPTFNQIEVSPFMYRPVTIKYFQEREILVAASKALHRTSGIDQNIVKSVADVHGVTPAQVLLRWGLQKRLIVIAKTSTAQRMRENRDVLHFVLSENEMSALDSLTTDKDIKARETLEIQRKNGI